MDSSVPVSVLFLGLMIHLVCCLVGDEHGTGLSNGQRISDGTSQGKIHSVLSHEMEAGKGHPDCTKPDSLVCIDVRKKLSGYKATVHTCPSVEKVHLKLVSPGHFKRPRHANLKMKTRGDRTGLTIHRPRRRQDVWISSPLGGEDIENSPALVWHYKAPTRWNNGTIWKKGTQCLHRINSRRKRETKDDKGYRFELNDMKHCGLKQSCIRFGFKDCGHLECEYLLTYRIVNRTMLHLEISARTNGWVALGLSSDNKMGGDDVIMCARRGPRGEMVAQYMATKVAHSKPQPHKVNDLNMVTSRVDGEFVFCRITRDLNDLSAKDAKVDLTNNWFQFYARGDISSLGFILKHTEIPPTSLETITMLRPIEINSLKYQQLPSSAKSVFSHPSIGITLVFYVMRSILFNVT